MTNNICISNEEVNQIITSIQKDKPNTSKKEIIVAIKSCCIQSEIIKENYTFLDCVRERVKMLTKL